ncbi:thiamine-phosphate kinase [Altericroceibacterium spongiae]|uniref:Thiamine-monophosphate kinase n=1 Tax=Altericroceibacterium spongiae TaxID=2320269 RepID=A0A420ECL1_9SPHN|nr:thiamine-phosphate kinase [Altericroceibacterium spongiae]RKF18405.1 thiamine-phosphate kinase [Altericroceibacterium spongiae]
MKGEADFIAALRAIAHHPAARMLNDDAAVLAIGSETLILTHDMIVEGVHYLPDQDPADIAWKLVATNLSDLAAKGAKPVGVLLGYMLGENDTRFLKGLRDILNTYDVPLLGGDTVSSGGASRTLGLTAIGTATSTTVPSRTAAMPGHGLYVTGRLGAAMMGFEALRNHIPNIDNTVYRRPIPRLTEGQALAPLVSSMMDISDGLLLDSWRLATASNVTLAIKSQCVPIAAPEERRYDALSWGDDYELLFTAASDTSLPVPATRIGEVKERNGAPLLLDSNPISDPAGLGYTHN